MEATDQYLPFSAFFVLTLQILHLRFARPFSLFFLLVFLPYLFFLPPLPPPFPLTQPISVVEFHPFMVRSLRTMGFPLISLNPHHEITGWEDNSSPASFFVLIFFFLAQPFLESQPK